MAEWPTPSVTSAEIVDGSIVDADVSASAAIQASKLSGVETPSGAQAKADAGQAAAEATAAADATSKANAAQSGAEATAAVALTAHDADTTAVHGIADTSDLILEGDARLTDARTPTTHASSHAAGGADVVTPLSIAALGLADTRASVLGRRWDFDTNPFDTDLGEWTVVTGSAPTVSGGVATPASSSQHIQLGVVQVGDVEMTCKITTAGTLGGVGANWALVAKASADAQDLIMGRFADAGGNARVELYRRDAGSLSSMAISSGGAYDIPISASTDYWLRFRIVGDVTTAELWDVDPVEGGLPIGSVSYTLVSTGKTKFGAGTVGLTGLRHSNSMVYPLDDLTIRPLTGRVTRRDVQTFTASGTWTAPANALLDPDATWEVVAVGPGGGGGAGARYASGTPTSGGAGGASGSVFRASGLVTDLYATSGTITIGAPGTGGAAGTTNDSGGASGTDGTHTEISGIGLATLRARAGRGGQGGKTSAASGGAPWIGGIGGLYGGSGVVGAQGGHVGGATVGAGESDHQAGAGSGGGGIDATPSFKPSGNGGFRASTSTGVFATTTDGQSGTAGTAQLIPLGLGILSSSGASGGSSSVIGAGGDGATASGGYGGGGGGGGSSLNGNASGAGGDGGPGVLGLAFTWTEAG